MRYAENERYQTIKAVLCVFHNFNQCSQFKSVVVSYFVVRTLDRRWVYANAADQLVLLPEPPEVAKMRTLPFYNFIGSGLIIASAGFKIKLGYKTTPGSDMNFRFNSTV